MLAHLRVPLRAEHTEPGDNRSGSGGPEGLPPGAKPTEPTQPSTGLANAKFTSTEEARKNEIIAEKTSRNQSNKLEEAIKRVLNHPPLKNFLIWGGLSTYVGTGTSIAVLTNFYHWTEKFNNPTTNWICQNLGYSLPVALGLVAAKYINGTVLSAVAYLRIMPHLNRVRQASAEHLKNHEEALKFVCNTCESFGSLLGLKAEAEEIKKLFQIVYGRKSGAATIEDAASQHPVDFNKLTRFAKVDYNNGLTNDGLMPARFAVTGKIQRELMRAFTPNYKSEALDTEVAEPFAYFVSRAKLFLTRTMAIESSEPISADAEIGRLLKEVKDSLLEGKKGEDRSVSNYADKLSNFNFGSLSLLNTLGKWAAYAAGVSTGLNFLTVNVLGKPGWSQGFWSGVATAAESLCAPAAWLVKGYVFNCFVPHPYLTIGATAAAAAAIWGYFYIKNGPEKKKPLN